MIAALVVIAVVAVVAIVALVVTARRAGVRLEKERARANRLEAQVHSLEEAAAAARSTPARPAAGTDRPEPATPVPPDEYRATAEPDRPGALDQFGGTTAPEATTAVPAEEPAATTAPPDSATRVPANEPTANGPEPTGPGPEPTAPEPATTAPEATAPEPTAPEPATTATEATAGEATAPEPSAPEPAPVPANQPAATTAPEPASPGRPDEPAAIPVSPAESVVANSQGGVAAKPLLELERLRLEREWADIVGTATPLPVPWDGSVRGVVAVELDIIREVIGTPSRIEPAATSRAAEPASAVATARLATEILRRLAKAGEEISVTFVTDTDVTMAIAVEGNEVKPDLSDLTTTAAELGGRLTLIETDKGFEAQLRVPSLPT